MTTLHVTKRENLNNDELRAGGKIPAVVYGRLVESTPIVLDYQAFTTAKKLDGENAMFLLEGDVTTNVLIQEIQYHPVTDKITHVDLYAVEKGKKVQVSVPLEFIGESEAVRGGAHLVKVMHEVEIEVDPTTIPQIFSVDISKLTTLEDNLTVADITVPSGVVMLEDKDAIVASVVEDKSEDDQIV